LGNFDYQKIDKKTQVMSAPNFRIFLSTMQAVTFPVQRHQDCICFFCPRFLKTFFMNTEMHILQYSMFNKTFIEFLLQYYLHKKDEWLTEETVINDMPSVNKNKELVSPGIQFLYRTNKLSFDGRNAYKISQTAIDDLQYEKDKELYYFDKLKVDLKNAVRVYKTYRTTQIITWVTFFVMLFLGFLKLAEALKVWPYHK